MTKDTQTDMSFNDALQKLGIEKYAERIFKSNSHGELFHLGQYPMLAKLYSDTSWFPEWFESIVKWAEENWERPESIFQHISKILLEEMKE